MPANRTSRPAAFPACAAVAGVAGVVAGFAIGVVAALMGVAGAVSLPTMVPAFARYSRDGSLAVLRAHARLVSVKALGSVAGTVAGGLPFGVVADAVLVPFVAVLPVLPAAKVWRHA